MHAYGHASVQSTRLSEHEKTINNNLSMRLKLFLSLLLTAVLTTMAQTAVVTGSVIDADTGSPIAGAAVTIPTKVSQ